MTAATLTPQLPASPRMLTGSLQTLRLRQPLKFIRCCHRPRQATSIATCVTLGSFFKPMFHPERVRGQRLEKWTMRRVVDHDFSAVGTISGRDAM